MRGRLLLREHQGQMIVQKWPRRRGKPKSALQQAWVNWFTAVAHVSKTPPQGQLDDMKGMVKNTGWYYRDLVTRAIAGKLIADPWQVRITIPTACVHKASAQALTANQWNQLAFDTTDWNVNGWLDGASANQLKAKTAGLYLVIAYLEYTTVSSSGQRFLQLVLNGVTTLGMNSMTSIATFVVRQQVTAIWYLNVGDQIQAQAYCTAASQSAQLLKLQVLGITPQTLT